MTTQVKKFKNSSKVARGKIGNGKHLLSGTEILKG